MADLKTQQEKEALEKLFKEFFLPNYQGQFPTDMPEGTPWLNRLGNKLFRSESMAREAFDDMQFRMAAGTDKDAALKATLAQFKKDAASPFDVTKTHVGDIAKTLDDGTTQTLSLHTSPLGHTATGAWNYAKANPGAVLGTAATTAGSLAGLFDNDKIGGQLVATGLGAAVPKLLGMKLNPLMAYNVAAGAGALGSLFDTLRAKKADERAAMQSYGREGYVR